MDELQQLVDVDAETKPARERDARRAVPPAQPLARRADGWGVRVARRIVDDVVALPWFVIATTDSAAGWALTAELVLVGAFLRLRDAG